MEITPTFLRVYHRFLWVVEWLEKPFGSGRCSTGMQGCVGYAIHCPTRTGEDWQKDSLRQPRLHSRTSCQVIQCGYNYETIGVHLCGFSEAGSDTNKFKGKKKGKARVQHVDRRLKSSQGCTKLTGRFILLPLSLHYACMCGVRMCITCFSFIAFAHVLV